MLSAARKNELEKFIKSLNIEKTDVGLLDVALTHPSFNFEKNADSEPDYERLEFLGDSVVRLVVSEYLFDKYKNFDEGKLTKIRSYLVSDDFFSKVAQKLELGKLLNIGPHETKDGGRSKDSILACALESVFGAVFKSVGFDDAKKFICSLYNAIEIDVNSILYMYNSKELLQQYTQAKNKDLPEYQIVSETGQAHCKMYEVNVLYHGEVLGRGIAGQKKEAEKLAAFDAIKKLNLVKG